MLRTLRLAVTLTIVSPADNQPLGIGMQATLSSDAAQIPGGWTLEASLLGTGGRILGFGQVQGLHTPSTEITIGRSVISGQPTEFWQAYPQFPDTPHGSTITLRADLRHPVDGVVESATRPITYDLQSGLQIALPALTRPTAGGGFTDADRLTANATLAAVQPVFPSGIVGVADAVMDLAEFFTRPPVEILRQEGQLLLTGRGVLEHPAASGSVSAYGAFLNLLTPPPGAGFRDGVIREYELRVIQVAVYGRHGNTQTYVKFLHDLDHAGQYLLWGGPFPRQIQFDVTPGFTVGWRWLVLGVQP